MAVILGTFFNDNLFGGIGNDLMDGGSGYDVADYTGITQAITFFAQGFVDKGLAGVDQLEEVEAIIAPNIAGNTIDASTVTSSYLTVNLSANSLEVNNAFVIDTLSFHVENFDNVIGTFQADGIIGNSNPNYLDGGGGSDYVDGGEGNDYIFGDLGNDALFGSFGDDTLDGGIGDDLLYGEIGNDTLLGNDGNDYLVGGEENDLVVGGAGSDILQLELSARGMIIRKIFNYFLLGRRGLKPNYSLINL